MQEVQRTQAQEFNYYLTKSMYLLEAASTFGFFLILSGGFLYVAGNIQHFANQTMEYLTILMRVLGFTAVGLNLNTLVLIVIWGIRTRHFPVWRLLFSLFCLVIGFFLSMGAVFADVLTKATGGV